MGAVESLGNSKDDTTINGSFRSLYYFILLNPIKFEVA
ncbi:hypothetical protein Slin_4833 [Spirosoma linguale DSM 74]|uniref:Uncharacterized protein n=1 Tax=Spirosoma linguale (strain ATCC 33905 / DSM 74 / LMG 10896 / Claus 1) TaxID=504472 RepID=D2QQN0_SPILD|nr:hypothetical protein Slin_4833 [Spirosoma linguale DSM 74]